uniref:D-aminoacyl-tRNA deacylase n=1 Tax=Candidatus Stercorousia sp. TaxID=3048886 RepID=UPI0040291624
MKALIQRVKRASVTIGGELFSAINSGILVFLGVEKGDEKENAEKLAQKIVNLRIFEDENEKMNLSLKDVNGEMLVVSQFTLCGDCKKGTRPSFDKAAHPDLAVDLYEYFIKCIEDNNIPVKTGKFRAMMDVELINDGPVTFWVEK